MFVSIKPFRDEVYLSVLVSHSSLTSSVDSVVKMLLCCFTYCWYLKKWMSHAYC